MVKTKHLETPVANTQVAAAAQSVQVLEQPAVSTPVAPVTAPAPESVVAAAQQQVLASAESVVNNSATQVPVTSDPVSRAAYMTIHGLLTNNVSKIVNARIVATNFTNIVPNTQLLVLIPVGEDRVKMCLIDDTNLSWINNVPTSEVESIRVEESGLFVETAHAKFIVTKTNTIKFVKENGKLTSMKSICRAKEIEKVTEESIEATSVEADLDQMKLYVKNFAPRIYKSVESLTTKEEIKAKVVEYINKVKDTNNMIKINKELVLATRM